MNIQATTLAKMHEALVSANAALTLKTPATIEEANAQGRALGQIASALHAYEWDMWGQDVNVTKEAA
jgi:uncharacterized iron-regulated protein